MGGGCLSTAILTASDFAFSCCQCHHSRGYLFLWNVRLRGERSLVPLLNTGSLMGANDALDWSRTRPGASAAHVR